MRTNNKDEKKCQMRMSSLSVKVIETIGTDNSRLDSFLRGLSVGAAKSAAMKYFFLFFLLLMFHSWTADSGILKGRHKNNNDDGVETLLAVGLIAKALSDIEKPSSTQCPPPVTKIIHVPVHTEKIYVVKENEKDWEESKNIWKESSNINWRKK